MITTTILPPPILQHFNVYLLDYLAGILNDVNNNIVPLAIMKIRKQDIGKQREFNKLYNDFLETYERKKIEEAEYKAKIKEMVQKEPCISNSGKTARFTRMEST